jgi:hypothetical protein
MMGTAAAASRACSAWTSRTWIQINTECPAGPALCPDLDEFFTHAAAVLEQAQKLTATWGRRLRRRPVSPARQPIRRKRDPGLPRSSRAL